MSASTILFANEKGGIGKTSLCFNIAWELTKKKKRILLIDMDGQSANLTFFCGYPVEDSTSTIFQVLAQGEEMKDSIKNIKENLDLLPANTMVVQLNPTLKIKKFKDAIRSIKDDYDYIFIDVNPNPTWSHALSLSVADYIVIPMLPHITSMKANAGIIESIEDIQDTTNPNLKVLGMIFNMYDSRTRLSKDTEVVATEMAKRLDTKLFDTKIRNATVAAQAVQLHVGVTEFKPNDNISKDYYSVVKEFEKRIKKLEKERAHEI